jgi:tRNA (cmo5U34)-methyltransferase
MQEDSNIMSDFDRSQWSDSDFAQEYRDNADQYIPDRHRMIGIAQSLYMRQIKNNGKHRVLDLGCGDGIYTYGLWKIDSNIEVTLVDAAPDMLDAARLRLQGLTAKELILSSFQDLLRSEGLKTTFDFVVSSLAIHHLNPAEKTALFQTIYDHLNPGGCFLNADVVIAPGDELERWYLDLWRDWIARHAANPDLVVVPDRYKTNPDNIPDTLMMQLRALEKIGFRQVDCYYKFGIFVMFGGMK